MLKSVLTILFFFIFNNILQANEIGQSTGYKIPRFVSLKSDDVNLRIGSSTNYPIILKYITKNMPVEITDEYERWRKIRDMGGNEGWIRKDLLKGDRYVILLADKKSIIKLYSKPDGVPIGEVGKFNIAQIKICLMQWCKIEIDNYKGWANKKNLWGVYKKEEINVPFYQPIINLIWKINSI